MGLSEDGDDNTKETFENLCKDLNMDAQAQNEAWEAVERITQNYTLEGNTLHWLACAVYVSCRNSLVPTVGRGVVKGNCVSLTRLLRSTKLSLIEFFKKMKKWADMANLPQEFQDKIDRLERNFAVSTVIFKKFRPIFLDIFQNPDDDRPKPPRSRKQRRLPCTISEVFNFCWTIFVQVKGNFSAISDDLVNSYHLLLCCIDWFYANALLSNRKDLLNPDFSGLPENFPSRDFKPPTTTPCIIQLLCEKHDGLQIEAKGIKEHWWKPYIRKLFDRREQGLKGKVDNLTGILELGNFEINSKIINKAYEEYLLTVGDFDERIFLGKDAAEEMGTPVKAGVSAVGELSERMQASRNLREHFDQTKSLTRPTPLTGRRYLKEKEVPVTPVSTATQSVSRLQTLLAGCQTYPSTSLVEIFSYCARNPTEEIVQRVKEMGETFCTKYAQSDDNQMVFVQTDFAKKRLQLAEGLYYKALENIMRTEQKRRDTQKMDFSNLLEQDILHRSLFACCLEIVIFSYNSQRTFPWIMETYNLPAYNFYKVIELLIRAEEGLSRDVVKHLNLIEETILESMAWKSDSPLWEAIKQFGSMPTVEDVSLPNQMEREGGGPSKLQSPPAHPALRRVAGTDGVTRKDPLLSPTGPTASDRFSSPAPGSVKRQLFARTVSPPAGSAANQSGPSGTTSPIKPTAAAATDGSAAAAGPQAKPQTLLAFQQTTDGRQMLIPVQVFSPPGQHGVSGLKVIAASQSNSPQATNKPSQPARPKRTGSLPLFFRKVYHLASVRLRELCERLEISTALRAKMWTCFEQCMIKHIELMKDRHLDQLIMCAVYVMAKVTAEDRSFQDIMGVYRTQPQAQSHVYRSVLLSSRRRRSSGDSDSSKNGGTSGTNSPVNTAETKDEKDKEKKGSDKLNIIRSSSTMPAPQPNSQPPTPTRLAGTGSSFEFDDRGEDRGDLITFYNKVYIPKIKNFALKFSPVNGEDAPSLSQLPVVRPLTQSPRRVSNKHSVYLSPIKNRPMSYITPQTKLLYCFNRSPAKDLRAINSMLKKNDSDPIRGKRRLPLQDDAPDDPTVKRQCSNASPAIQRKIEGMLLDRQATNGTQ